MKNSDWRLATESMTERGTDRTTGTEYVRHIDFSDTDGKSDGGTDRSGQRKVRQVPGLGSDRVEEIRRRIEDGTYLTESMAEQVARAMIARGELRR